MIASRKWLCSRSAMMTLSMKRLGNATNSFAHNMLLQGLTIQSEVVFNSAATMVTWERTAIWQHVLSLKWVHVTEARILTMETAELLLLKKTIFYKCLLINLQKIIIHLLKAVTIWWLSWLWNLIWRDLHLWSLIKINRLFHNHNQVLRHNRWFKLHCMISKRLYN